MDARSLSPAPGVLEYCQEAVATLGLTQSGIFDFVSFEAHMQSMIGPFPPTVDQRAALLQSSRERFLSALVAIIAPKQQEIDALREQISNQARLLSRERQRRAALEISGPVTPAIARGDSSHDNDAISAASIPSTAIKTEPAMPQENAATPPLASEPSTAEDPQHDGKDDDDDEDVKRPFKLRKRKTRSSSVSPATAAPSSSSRDDQRIPPSNVLKSLFAHECVTRWISPDPSKPPTMVIWFTPPASLLQYQSRPKRKESRPFALICKIHPKKGQIEPLGVLHPIHELPEPQPKSVLDGVTLPDCVDSSFWTIWENHPFMSERHARKPLRGQLMPSPTPFFPPPNSKASSSLYNAAQQYSNLKPSENPLVWCEIVTPTPVPRFEIKYKRSSYVIQMTLEDLRRQGDHFHPFFNFPAAEILALKLRDPRAVIEKFGTEISKRPKLEST